MDAYYGMGLPYLFTLGVGAAVLILLVTTRVPWIESLVFSCFYALPVIAMVTSYVFTRRYATGAGWRPVGGALLSLLIGVVMLLGGVVGNFVPVSRGHPLEEIIGLVLALFASTAGFPIVRFMAARKIRKFGPRFGLVLRKRRIEEVIQQLRAEESEITPNAQSYQTV